MVTGHPDLSTAVEALRQGAYDYIGKPVTRQALLAVVERACERAALRREKKAPRGGEPGLPAFAREKSAGAHRAACASRRAGTAISFRRRGGPTTSSRAPRRSSSAPSDSRPWASWRLRSRTRFETRWEPSPIPSASSAATSTCAGDDRRLLDVVHEEAERLESIVADFLKFARPRPIHRTPQNLAELLDDLLLLLAQKRPLGRGSGKAEERDRHREALRPRAPHRRPGCRPDPRGPLEPPGERGRGHARRRRPHRSGAAVEGGRRRGHRLRHWERNPARGSGEDFRAVPHHQSRRYRPRSRHRAAGGRGPRRGPSRSPARRDEGSSFRLRFPVGSDERQSIPTTR